MVWEIAHNVSAKPYITESVQPIAIIIEKHSILSLLVDSIDFDAVGFSPMGKAIATANALRNPISVLGVKIAADRSLT